MTRIVFIEADGSQRTVEARDGRSVMEAATIHGIEGLVAECGGACTCGTCHCYVDEARLVDVPPPSNDEREMLEFVAAERRPNSRLSCQIKVTAAMQGLVIRLPSTQT